MKNILVLLGVLSLVLGITGIFLPLLPTTPFVLLSAWLFAKSSPKLHAKLLENKMLGKIVQDFQEDKSISLHAKLISTSLLWISILYAIFIPAQGKIWLQILLALIASGVSIHILSYKTKKSSKKN